MYSNSEFISILHLLGSPYGEPINSKNLPMEDCFYLLDNFFILQN
jgi:hypothetical protein